MEVAWLSKIASQNLPTNLRGRDNWVCVHDPIWVLLSDLGDEQGAHAGAGAAAQGVGQLEALQAVAGLRFFSNHIQHTVNQLGTLNIKKK